MISGHHALSAVVGVVAGAVTGSIIAVFAPTHAAALYSAIALGGLVVTRIGVLAVADDPTIVIKPWALSTGFMLSITIIAILGNSYLSPPPSEVSAASNTAPTLLPFGR